jgi:hypothetical protein
LNAFFWPSPIGQLLRAAGGCSATALARAGSSVRDRHGASEGAPSARQGAKGRTTEDHYEDPLPYLRRAKPIEDILPWVYLKGISTGGFSGALAALLARDLPDLSVNTISRVKVD